MLANTLAGLSFLIIGDSHLTMPHSLIETLHTELIERGASVSTYGVCGANAGDWLQATPGTCRAAERIESGPVNLLPQTTSTRPISDLLQQKKPDVIVVVMGDTMASYDKDIFPKTWAWQQVGSLTKAIAKENTTCVWVGPTWGTEGGKYKKSFARVRQVSAFLSSNVAPCTYIDSLTFSEPGAWATTDGQHLTASGYRSWGEAIAEVITDIPTIQEKK